MITSFHKSTTNDCSSKEHSQITIRSKLGEAITGAVQVNRVNL